MPGTAAAADLTFVGQFGGVIGSGPGQFTNPDDLAVDSAGNVYVADTTNNRIQKFTAGGTVRVASSARSGRTRAS